MGGGYGGSMMFFGWINSILVSALLVIGIIAKECGIKTIIELRDSKMR